MNAGFTEDMEEKAVLYFTSFVDKGLLCVSHSSVADIYPEIPVQVTPSAHPHHFSDLFPACHQQWEQRVGLLGTAQQPLDSRAQVHKERGLIQF